MGDVFSTAQTSKGKPLLKQGFPAVELTGLGDYKGPTTGGPDPGRTGVSYGDPSVFDNYDDAQAFGFRKYGAGTQNVKWWISLSKKGKLVVEAEGIAKTYESRPIVRLS